MPLPAKPYTPPVMPGPAPPLPAGPAPQPGYQQQQDAAAAHAAAWAAYYQAQGQAYPAATAQAGSGAAAPAGQNPYANYGYGGAAQQQHLAQGQGFAQPHAGPSQYRPPPAQAYPAGYQAVAPGYAGQQPAYNAQAGYQGTPPQQGGYQTPQPGYPPQPFGPQQPAQAPYRPPAGPQQPFNGPQQPYQQYNGPPRPPQQYPPQNFRPSPSPGPPPNRPFQQNPQMMGRVPSGPSSRPPVHTPPSIPPAKRPRFDGPKGPAGVGMQSNRPPVRPVGINNGQPGFNPNPPTTNPVPASSGIPSRPPVAPANAPSRSSAPPPTSRPPIHLGLNGPPPVLPFAPQAPMSGIPGVRMGGVVPVAPPLRGGRGLGRGGSTIGMANAPKGPSGMRRSDLLPRHPNAHHHREIDRKRKEKEREREKEKEAKTTMTDFRIVGIEMKSLGWSWGDVNGQTAESESANDVKEVGSGPEVEVKVEDVKGEEAEAEPEAEAGASSETVEKEEGGGVGEPGVKTEDVEVKHEPDSETVEEKRGAKRKAKSPEGDEGSSPKKRSGDYILTHGKPNEPLSASHESNQNRFRIYFESPPELDRVPKALRRNPNKRWRREESGSVAPSRQGREETVMTVGTVAEEGDGVAPTEAEATVEAEIGVEVDGEEKAVDGEVEKPVEGVSESAVEQSSQQGEVAISQQDAETSAPTGDTGALHTRAEDESAVAHATLAADHTGDVEAAAAIDLPPQPVETAEETAPTTADTEEDADVSMRTDGGAIAEAIDEVDQITDPAAPTIDTEASVTEEIQADTASTTIVPPAAESAVEDTAGSAIQAATTVESAEESKPPTPLPTQTRTRRRSSVSTTGPERSRDDVEDGERAQLEEYERAHGAIGSPSTNRLSILYQDSSRRLCFDASIVDKVRIHRSEGKIEVVLAKLEPKIVNGDKAESSGKAEGEAEGEEKDKVELEKSDEAEAEARTPLPKGILVEMYDKVDQRFASATKEQLAQMYAETNTETNHLPPLHQATSEPITVTVYLNKKRPLSEPKWCRTNSADEWLIEQFGSKRAATEAGWSGKLEIADPDPAPTLENIMDSWASSTSSTTGPSSDRKAFTASLLSDPYDLLEILLRLTRGERNPTPGATGGSASSLGLLATAIRPDSPYASHQTHVSLAILAMYRLTTDYAQKAGEQSNVMNEKISDIIKSLPVGMIHKSLDGLYREWATGDRKK